MRSIQSRLALGLTLSLIFLLLAQWLVVSISIRYVTENYIASHLLQDSESLLASLSLANDKPVSLNILKLGPVFSQPFSGQYYKITVGNTIFRSRSLWDTDLSHSELSNEIVTQAIVTGPLQQILLQVSNRYTKNAKQITISVAEDLTPIYKDIKSFQIRFSLVTLFIVFLLIAVQAIIVKKNLKPLDNIRQELKSLDEGLIDKLQENVPIEVLPLVRELNQQLKAYRKRLDRSRKATGNLAHSLKTPLSLLYQLADDPLIKHNDAVKESLLQAAKTIDHNINRELKRSRIAGSQLAAKHSKLEPELQSLIETLTIIYQQRNLNIHYRVPIDMVCYMDRQDLLEMLGNVLDNACKWAKHEVLISVVKTDEIEFSIEDDGAGCSADEITALTNRGTRFDEQSSGSGLGLSIVQGIVDDYNGELRILTSKTLGGLKVKIRIPFTK
ncbi:MAG: ATP-binding protein [Gammaproteobacteria bacterium]